MYVSSSPPGQNGHHFTNDIFKCIFLNENVWIAIKISLKFVLKCPIDKMPALVQIMAWRRTGDKPLSEPMMTYDVGAYMRHSASMSLHSHLGWKGAIWPSLSPCTVINPILFTYLGWNSWAQLDTKWNETDPLKEIQELLLGISCHLGVHLLNTSLLMAKEKCIWICFTVSLNLHWNVLCKIAPDSQKIANSLGINTEDSFRIINFWVKPQLLNFLLIFFFSIVNASVSYQLCSG